MNYTLTGQKTLKEIVIELGIAEALDQAKLEVSNVLRAEFVIQNKDATLPIYFSTFTGASATAGIEVAAGDTISFETKDMDDCILSSNSETIVLGIAIL